MTLSALYEHFLAHPTVTTDTRHCPEGSIFFALRGAKFDGNQFAAQALEAGCALAVVDDAQVVADERYLLVDDVLASLQALAQHHRLALGTPIVQITGTNGKTTTKELVAAVLSERYNILYTEGNLNNHIGVPLTLLRLRPEHEIAVIETGANHPGEIALLSNLVQPTCGLITNVGKAHLEGFGSFEGVIRTKTELYAHLRERNVQCSQANASGEQRAFIFLDTDNEHLAPLATDLPQCTYSEVGGQGQVQGEVLSCAPLMNLHWQETERGEWHVVHTQLIGAYNLKNVLAAVSIGLRFGVSPEQIDHALAHYSPRNNRSEFRQTAHNRLIVDAYNANLSSMQAAIQNFAQIDDAQKLMILGEMRELGSASAAAHAEVLQLAASAGCREVWLVGSEFSTAYAATFALTPQLIAARIRLFGNVEAVQNHLREQPLTDHLVLIKGSNGTRLFELPEAL